MRSPGRSVLRACAVAAACAACAACGHNKGGAKGPGADDAGLPPLIKSVAISLQAAADGDVSHVFLAAMDETGKTTSYPVGDVPGACAAIAADGADLVTLECKGGASTVRVHAITQSQDVVVLRENIAAGGAPDPMNREEIGRYSMPVDAKIEAAR